MIGKFSGGTGRYLSYFGKDIRRYREVPGGTFPIFGMDLVLVGTSWYVYLGTSGYSPYFHRPISRNGGLSLIPIILKFLL